MNDFFGFFSLFVFISFCIVLYLAVDYKKRRNTKFVVVSILILGIKVLYVLVYCLLVHQDGLNLSPDEVRYFHEIRQIARNPFVWNPILGRGPDYQVTAKMGMSFFYGLILFFFQVESYRAVILINIILAYFTSVIVFKLAFLIVGSNRVALISMFISAIYPEILFWNSRILRENVTLLLVPTLVYTSILLIESYSLKRLISVSLVSFFLLLTRAQLVMFLPLILLYYAMCSKKRSLKDLTVFSGMIIGFIVILPVFSKQITRAIGGEFLLYFNLDYRFWMQQVFSSVSNLAYVLSLRTKSGFGSSDILMLPFTLGSVMLVIYSFVHRKQIYRKNKGMGLLLFLYACFVLMLAVTGSVNIRFRATVAPLLMPIVATTVEHLLSQLMLTKPRKV